MKVMRAVEITCTKHSVRTGASRDVLIMVKGVGEFDDCCRGDRAVLVRCLEERQRRTILSVICTRFQVMALTKEGLVASSR